MKMKRLSAEINECRSIDISRNKLDRWASIARALEAQIAHLLARQDDDLEAAPLGVDAVMEVVQAWAEHHFDMDLDENGLMKSNLRTRLLALTGEPQIVKGDPHGTAKMFHEAGIGTPSPTPVANKMTEEGIERVVKAWLESETYQGLLSEALATGKTLAILVHCRFVAHLLDHGYLSPASPENKNT